MAKRTGKLNKITVLSVIISLGIAWYYTPLVSFCQAAPKSPVSKEALTKRKTPDLSSMVLIPAGKFIFGTDPDQEKKLPPAFGMIDDNYQNETPRQSIFIKAFYIDRYEVTIGEYKDFIKVSGQLPKAWVDLNMERWQNFPAQGVTWEEANDYLHWAGKRLPTEKEWEKAARGPKGLIYVFGNKFDPKKARTDLKDTIPVAETNFDKSYYGVFGMSGNLSEWCADWFGPHPENDYNDRRYGKKNRVYKGGSWVDSGHYNLPSFYRCARRGFGLPNRAYGDIGFRGVYSAN